MKGIVADVNFTGHWQILLVYLQSDEWRETWQSLNLSVETFASLGLDRRASDAAVWHTCQGLQVALLTDNRNEDDPDSLEATIRRSNAPYSLPVFTVANAKRVIIDKNYAKRVAERLLEYLLEIDNVRGTGRLYLP